MLIRERLTNDLNRLEIAMEGSKERIEKIKKVLKILDENPELELFYDVAVLS